MFIVMGNIIKYLLEPFLNKTMLYLTIFITLVLQAIDSLLDKVLEIHKNESIFNDILVLGSIVIVFQTIDMITGIIASKKSKNTIRSSKLQITINKYISTFLLMIIVYVIYKFFGYSTTTKFGVRSLFILYIIKEFISIGENFEARFKYKFYIFTIFDKLFDLFENFLISKVEKFLKGDK